MISSSVRTSFSKYLLDDVIIIRGPLAADNREAFTVDESMGGLQSTGTRKISVPNDDTSGVIKVSDSIVQRLKGGAEVKESKSENPVSQAQSNVQPVTSSFPPSVYGGVTPKTSLEIRQDKEEA
jgi:hypothetical protein